MMYSACHHIGSLNRNAPGKVGGSAMKHVYAQILNPCDLAPCDNCRNFADACPMK